MRENHAKEIAVSAMFTAISVLLCFLACFFPTISLSITAITGLITAASIFCIGYKYSVLVYISSSILMLLIIPDKQCVAFYILLFGHYPMLKQVTERIKNRVIMWLVKILEALALYSIMLLVDTFLLCIEEYVGLKEILLTTAIFIPMFVLYDICIDRIMKKYLFRILQNRRLL